MKIVRVTYKVKESYVAQNKANIEQVMSDLRMLNNPNIKYASYIEDYGLTFMHFAQYPDGGTAGIISSLDSFAKFRTELKASNPTTPPEATNLSLVSSAYDLF